MIATDTPAGTLGMPALPSTAVMQASIVIYVGAVCAYLPLSFLARGTTLSGAHRATECCRGLSDHLLNPLIRLTSSRTTSSARHMTDLSSRTVLRLAALRQPVCGDRPRAGPGSGGHTAIWSNKVLARGATGPIGSLHQACLDANWAGPGTYAAWRSSGSHGIRDSGSLAGGRACVQADRVNMCRRKLPLTGVSRRQPLRRPRPPYRCVCASRCTWCSRSYR